MRAIFARAIAAMKRELRPRALFLRLFTFFAAPTDGSGAAVFRIAYGLLAASVALWTALNAERWFSNTGVMLARGGALKSSLYRFAQDATWMPTLHVAMLAVGALLLVVGFFPRIGALLVFVAHTSLQHRTPQILNSGDRLFAIIALLAITLPLGHRASVHAWWRRRRGKPTPHASMWGMRLIQIQIAYVYASTALSKMQNGRWLAGKALRDVLASPVFAEWPTWVGFWPLVYAMTWGTLVFELGFPTLVWFRKLRPWLLLAGIGFHLGIDLLMIIPMFSYIMIVSYAAFLDDDIVHRWFAWAGLGKPRATGQPTEVPPTMRSASDAPPAETSAIGDQVTATYDSATATTTTTGDPATTTTTGDPATTTTTGDPATTTATGDPTTATATGDPTTTTATATEVSPTVVSEGSEPKAD